MTLISDEFEAALEDSNFERSDLSGGETDFYPTEWNKLTDHHEFRQLNAYAPVIYEIRSATHVITLPEIGFKLFQDDTLQGQVLFEDWCKRYDVGVIPRRDVESNAL